MDKDRSAEKRMGHKDFERHRGMFVKHGPRVTQSGAKLILEDSTRSGLGYVILCCSRDLFTLCLHPRSVPIVL